MLEGDENFIFFDDDDPSATEIKSVLSNLQVIVIVVGIVLSFASEV